MKPRIFLGSSTQQAKLLSALGRGLDEIADVDPWMTVFNPGVSTLDRLVELTHEVDFAAFVFGQDDWTSPSRSDSDLEGRRWTDAGRHLRATTSSSRPACSAGRWACAARSSSTRGEPSSRPTSSA